MREGWGKTHLFLLMKLSIHDRGNILIFVGVQVVNGEVTAIHHTVTKAMLSEYLKPGDLVIHVVNSLQRALNHEVAQHG